MLFIYLAVENLNAELGASYAWVDTSSTSTTGCYISGLCFYYANVEENLN